MINVVARKEKKKKKKGREREREKREEKKERRERKNDRRDYDVIEKKKRWEKEGKKAAAFCCRRGVRCCENLVT